MSAMLVLADRTNGRAQRRNSNKTRKHLCNVSTKHKISSKISTIIK